MPEASGTAVTGNTPDRLPFPPLTKSHIRNCAVPSWHQRYRGLVPKTRIIPLNDAFVAYLRSDGIVLPPDDTPDPEWDNDDGTAEQVVPLRYEEWKEVHELIKQTIMDLGGKVYPKLNWSAPKDATWMAATNTMECQSPEDIYLLLKSSDFVTHDLQQAYYGCEDAETQTTEDEIKYSLVLRKAVTALITSMEFRCFVRRRRLIAICQRDINHYDFMPALIPTVQGMVYDFFNDKVKTTFPDENFVFDVYVPRPRDLGRVWLIDINPWAPRTDPLLFSWLELLTCPDLPEEPRLEDDVVRLQITPGTGRVEESHVDSGYDTADTVDEVDDGEEIDLVATYLPDFRIVKRDDPETYSFNTPLYSAHKLPKDVVDASMTVSGEGGMRDFLENWQDKVAVLEARRGQESDSE